VFVNYDVKKELFIVKDNPEAPRFVCIEAAFGWLDVKGEGDAHYHWCVSAGITAERKILFLEEHHGPLHRLVEEVIDMKDRLLIERIYADYREVQICAYLSGEDCDGLTRYHSRGRDLIGRPIYHHRPEHWPNFRGRDARASLVPIYDEDVANFLAGYHLLVHAVSAPKQTVQIRRDCKTLPNVIKSPLKEVVDHPALKAMVWLHNGLSRKLAEKSVESKSCAIYANLPRG
jgi:hypothetical protein